MQALRAEVGIAQVSKATARRATLATGEAVLVVTHRRGLERAAEVCTVQDGAEWLQGLVDYHRADAVCLLDFARAAEYVNEIGQAVRAAGGRLAAKCLEVVLHRLKHQGPHRVLKHLAWLVARCPSPAMQEKLSYLQKREAHMQYPTYQQAGWPIGSGSVESANKVVVEARPKGAGMRLPSAERQPHARAPQCGLQSLVARDLGDVSGSSTSASHESATSRQKASTGKRLLVPRLLESTDVSAVSSTCSRCHLTDG
jgi:hypothetical protein